MSSKLTYGKEQIKWRRAQVLDLDAQGHSIMEIAKILHISHGTVHNDLLYLRKQAQENLQKHIQERIPEEYQKAVVGINKVLKTCWNIINKDTTDDKIKLQATAIINDSYKYLMDLTTNGVVITDAIKYVRSQMDHLNKTEKALVQNISQQKEENSSKDYKRSILVTDLHY
jgi:hypothetical protein